MFEKLKIKMFGDQPTPNITDKILDRIIEKDYSNDFHEIKKKLELIESDSKKGKNRFAAAVLKLADRDLTKIDSLIEVCNNDFRDVIMQAEYPRTYKDDFDDMDEVEEKNAYLDDWTDYLKWLNKY
ncbi:MAG: hypothetical protein KA713_01320 [Chryseotalea sp. WA131a]|nr:MAG: hypothetical protein KA713_01320 [Chryseotalea sp. WA131a]